MSDSDPTSGISLGVGLPAFADSDRWGVRSVWETCLEVVIIVRI